MMQPRIFDTPVESLPEDLYIPGRLRSGSSNLQDH